VKASGEKGASKEIFHPRGQRNPLKRFKTAKRIQGKSKLFSLIFFARALPGFAGFG
jgi:hypothetical protein